MFEAPDVMRIAQDMARHAAKRQTLSAKNTANADTPGYRAMDNGAFADAVRQSPRAIDMRTTHAAHLNTADRARAPRVFEIGGEASPNGNTVSLELELVRAGRAKSEHDTALSIYKSSLDMMRTALGRGR